MLKLIEALKLFPIVQIVARHQLRGRQLKTSTGDFQLESFAAMPALDNNDNNRQAAGRQLSFKQKKPLGKCKIFRFPALLH